MENCMGKIKSKKKMKLLQSTVFKKKKFCVYQNYGSHFSGFINNDNNHKTNLKEMNEMISPNSQISLSNHKTIPLHKLFTILEGSLRKAGSASQYVSTRERSGILNQILTDPDSDAVLVDYGTDPLLACQACFIMRSDKSIVSIIIFVDVQKSHEVCFIKDFHHQQ